MVVVVAVATIAHYFIDSGVMDTVIDLLQLWSGRNNSQPPQLQLGRRYEDERRRLGERKRVR